jgi:hypothetical protein
MLTITMHRAIRNCKHAKVNLRRTTDDTPLPPRGGDEVGKKDFVFFVQVKSFVKGIVTRVTQGLQFAWLKVCYHV